MTMKEEDKDILLQVGITMIAGIIIIVCMLALAWLCAIFRGDV